MERCHQPGVDNFTLCFSHTVGLSRNLPDGLC
jgi:hypothetical protein